MKTSNLFSTILAGMLLFTFSPGKATNYYVDGNAGNNANNGSIANPVLTITYGMSLLVAGDVLYVKNGTYVEGVNISLHATSWGTPFTIKAYPGHTPVIRPDGGSAFSQGGVNFRNISSSLAQFVIFEGFVVDAQDISQNAMSFEDGASDIRIKDCEIRNATGVKDGIYTYWNSYRIELINVKSHNHGNAGVFGLMESSMTGCEIYNNAYGVTAGDMEILKSNVHDNASGGISVQAGSRIINNIVWSNGGLGIGAAGADNYVYNNTSVDNGHGIYISNTSGVNYVKNNICVDNSSQQIQDQYTPGGNVITYNLTSGDPLFVNASIGNFRLQAGSPAINAGAALTTDVPDDADDVTRPQRGAHDQGAYERIHDFYVHGASGSNSNNGLEASPFQTITYGLSKLAAGDVLYVKNGTYVEGVNISQQGTSWGNPVTIRAYSGHNPVIRPDGGSAFSQGGVNFREISSSLAQFVIFEGFVVDAQDISQNAMSFEDGASDIRIKDCEIMNATGSKDGIYAYWTSYRIELIDVKSHNHANAGVFGLMTSSMTGCEIYDNEYGVMAGDMEILKSNIHDNNSHGILTLTAGSRIINNIVWGNGGQGIGPAGAGNYIYNNTSVDNGHGIYITNTSGVNYVKNNICVGNSSQQIQDQYTPGGNVISDNLTGGSPLFVDPSNGDFHLSCGSPAIAAGATLSVDVPEDYDHVSRSAPYEIGAFEFAGCLSPGPGSPNSVRQASQRGQTDLINVYPNPSSNKVSIVVPASMAKNYKVSLFDLSGRMIMEIPGTGARDLQNAETVISLEQVPAGAYFVKVTSQGNEQIQKLIIAR